MDQDLVLRRFRIHETSFEETNSWDLSEQKDVLQATLAKDWTLISSSMRAFAFVDPDRFVKIVNLNSVKLLSYQEPGPSECLITNAVSVSDSPFCGKMIVVTDDKFII